MGYLRLALLMSLLSATAIIYQNCGSYENAPSSVATSSVNESDPTPIPQRDVSTLAFRAGDAVAVDNIPTQRSYLLNELDAYLADNSFKAIALTIDGYGFMMFQRAGSILVSESQEEANRRALEACQFTSSNRPCSIFAEGNVVKFDEDRFLTGMKRAIDLNLTQYDPNNVPLITDEIRRTRLSDYTNAPNQKALALSITGGGGYRFGAQISQNTARVEAVSNCESQPNNDVCFLYAVNGQVVLDEQALIDYFNNYIREN